MQTFTPFDGALLIDKPKGPTSHDVVDAIRGIFQIRKVGHAGTLDPNATGLLILLLGRATRLSEKLMADDKVYSGTARFGQTTNTYDADGEILDTQPFPDLSLNQLNAFAKEFVGDQMQTPPMVSAVKKDGVPLYKLARQGLEVERNPRLIHIYNFRFSEYAPPLAHFRLACTKGTYVRSVVHELGQKLACGAYLLHLRREISGRFDVSQALLFEEVLKLSKPELEPHVIPFLQLAG